MRLKVREVKPGHRTQSGEPYLFRCFAKKQLDKVKQPIENLLDCNCYMNNHTLISAAMEANLDTELLDILLSKKNNLPDIRNGMTDTYAHTALK